MADATFLQALAENGMLQRAAVAGLLCGLCCAALSPLVVLRRMAFVGDGMAHAAYGGMGISLYLLSGAGYGDVSVQLLTLGFCLAVGGAVAFVSRRNSATMGEDSAIGVAFAVSLALGALLMRLRQLREPQYAPPLEPFLFGSLLNVGGSDVLLLAILSVSVLTVLLLFRKEILFYTFDSTLAEISGNRIGGLHYLFMSLLVTTVVISTRVVGIILVSASLILPGVIALRLARRLYPAMALAALVGVVSFGVGLVASYEWNWPTGSAIVLFQFVLLLVASVAKKLSRAD